MKKIFLFLIILLVFFIVTTGHTFAQTVDNTDAPTTDGIVTDCLAAGGSSNDCAQEGANYLNSLDPAANGCPPSGCNAQANCDTSGCTVTCDNGGSVRITNPPPPAQPNQPPPPPPPSSPPPPPVDNCADGSCDEEPTPTNTPTPTKKVTPTVTKTPTPTGPSSTPTATKTPTPTRTPTPTPTLSPTPTASPTPTSSPTPTPIPFNPDSCKCDGIEYSNLAGGQNASITSYGKVEGADIPRSQITNQTFHLYEGAETTATRLLTSSPIPATIVSQDGGKVRYKSVWQFTMPTLKNGLTYRIQSKINCQPKTVAMASSNVLGTTTSTSFFGNILNFLTNLFGGQNNTQIAPTPTPTQPVIIETQNTNSNVQNATQDQIQLGTFQPTQVYQKTCTFIKFRAGI